MADDNPRTLADERRRLLGELELERKQLLRNIEWCRIRDIDRPFIGEWSLKDIVGHIASWEAEVVTALRDLAAGRTPALLAFDAAKLHSWNQDHVERKRDIDFFSLLEQLRSGRARLLEEITTVSDEDLADDTSHQHRLVRAVAEHDRDHWHQIAAKLAGMPGARSSGTESVVQQATASS